MVGSLVSWQANATIAYNTPTSTTANQSTGPYSLGMDFTVNQNITVTRLGVFDAGQNGISGSVTVGIYTTGGSLVGSSFTFSGTTSPLLPSSAYRFDDVPDFGLMAGSTYRIVVYSMNGSANPGYNSMGSPTLINLDTGGGALTFGANYYNLTPGSFPTTLDVAGNPTGPPGRYGAGSFEFVVPEASSFALAGVGLLGLVYIGRSLVLRRQIA